MKKLVGHYESAKILGWQKQQVATYIKRGKFPEPLQKLKGGPIWFKEDIEKFKESRDGKMMNKEEGDTLNLTIQLIGMVFDDGKLPENYEERLICVNELVKKELGESKSQEVMKKINRVVKTFKETKVFDVLGNYKC